MKTLTATVAILALFSGAAFASHANPWATEDDTVLAKNHDDNQVRSVDTPGEDEMNGVMTRSARGKLDADLGGGAAQAANGAGGSGAGAGAGAGNGGGNGHGGRD